MDLNKLQSEQKEWGLRNFGEQPAYRMLLGAMEELGELAHAQLKGEQGIRTGEDHSAAKKDAIGDIVIYLAGYCNAEGINMAEAVETAWNEVKQRDWVTYPKNGRTE